MNTRGMTGIILMIIVIIIAGMAIVNARKVRQFEDQCADRGGIVKPEVTGSRTIWHCVGPRGENWGER